MRLQAAEGSICGTMMTRDDLIYRADFLADAPARDAHAALLRRVFQFDPGHDGRRPTWVPFAFFEADGTCVAAIEAAVLEMVLDGEPVGATGIRLAAVDPRRRGQGLFRALMTRVLAWCEPRGGPTLLFTEDEELYVPHGFRAMPQHLFVGAAPAAPDTSRARIVGRDSLEALLDRLAPARAPLSCRCAIVGADDLLRANLRAADDIVLAHAEHLDALIAYEVDGDHLTIVDVVAAAIPTMAVILGSLPERPRLVTTTFPPDRLAWPGRPVAEETGLMLRGPVPAAMRRPFMLPPTVEF